MGVNPAGAGGVGTSVSVGVAGWEGRAGVDSNGNYQAVGGYGWDIPKWATRNFGQLRFFTGVGYSSKYGGVDVTDIELKFRNIGPGGFGTGIRYQNQTPLSDILGFLLRRRDPMVIDLGNDGLTLTPLRFSTAAFDFGGDGAREITGWIGANEGIVVSDVDHDGKISSLADLFGDGNGDAFSRLGEYDENGDGAITVTDSIFASLRIWRDANADGFAQAEELIAPGALNIASIGVRPEAVNRDVDGNHIINSGLVTLQNGSALNSYSLAFATDGSINAGVSPDVDIPDDLIALPNMHGFGNVRELWDWALAAPSNKADLKNAVHDFADADNLSSMVGSWSFSLGTDYAPATPFYHMSKFEKFIANWAGVSGGSDDEKIKAIAEKFAGHALPLAFAGNIGFYDVFMEFSANLALRFLQQTALAPAQAAGLSLTRALIGLDADALANLTQSEFEQLATAAGVASVTPPKAGSLAAGLGITNYNFATDSFPDGLAEAIASRLHIVESDSPSQGWSKVRSLRSDDPWLFTLGDKLNPDISKGSVTELALRIASHNRILPVHGVDHQLLNGTAGDDILSKLSGVTPLLIVAEGGSDIIYGGTEDTTVVFSVINGQSIISDAGGADEIAFTTLLPSDVSFRWVPETNVFTIVGPSGSVAVKDAFDATGVPRIERISFSDGTVFAGVEIRSAALSALTTSGNDTIVGWQRSQILSGGDGADSLTGGDERDFLSGGAGADFLSGGGGDDVVSGDAGDDTIVESGGNDTYFWSPNEGDDLLTGGGSWDGYNSLQFTDGIIPEDLLFSYGTTGGRGVRMSVADSTGSITMDMMLIDGQAQVDEFIFGDGRRLSRSQLLALAMPQLAKATDGQVWGSQFNDVLEVGAGDDRVIARNGDDILIGGTGNDFLSGGGGNDVYRFAKGDGNDTILEAVDRWDGGEGGNDRIELGEGITAADVTVTQAANGNDLLLTIAGGDSIYITGQVTNGANFIEQLVFADGTIWDRTEMFKRSIIATEGADRLYGTQDGETIAGGAGDDWISARNGDDIIVGGTGNDFLSGGGGNDVYRFAKGDGNDTIVDGVDRWDGGEGGNDRLELGEGITAADVTVTQAANGNDLLLTIAGGDSIYISGQVTNGANFIEQLVFADGSIWDRTEMFNRSIIATEGADRFYGTQDGETIAGGAGDDWISARNGDDIVVGGTGNDFLSGGGGNDVYRFAKGDGNDTIVDGVDRWDGGEGGNDRLELGEGITAADVTVTQAANGNDLLLTIAGGDSIYISGQVTNGANFIEQLVFSDGTIWDRTEMFKRSIIATEGADRFYGTQDGETLAGGAGDDWISARNGDDILVGGTGNDFLSGGGGNDIYRFAKGDGNDTIVDGVDRWDGGEGGNDRIELGEGITAADVTVSQAANGNDLLLTIAGGDSIDISGQVTNGANFIEQLLFADGTVWDRTEMFKRSIIATEGADRFYGTQDGETIVGGAGDDWISARNGDDIVVGGTGNDFLSGGGGNDVYRFAKGDGNDTIVDGVDRWDGGEGGNDRLELGEGITVGNITISQQNNGNDLLLTIAGGDSIYITGQVTNGANQIEELVFADGTIWNAAKLLELASNSTPGDDRIYGTQGNELISAAAGNDWVSARNGDDVLIGGTGNDFLSGGGGNDVYRFAKGDGNDTIVDGVDRWDGGEGGDDRIELGAGIAANDVTVSQQNNGNDLLLTIAGGDSIYIGGAPITNGAQTIENVVFADGTVWTAADLFARSTVATAGNDRFYGTHGSETLAGGAGDDWISARNGDDVLVGGTGNDFLSGGGGNDVYRFAKGDGNDTIVDAVDRWDGGEGGDDRIELGAGIAASDVTVSQQANGNDLLLTIAGGDSIYIGGAPITNGAQAIEKVVFADGTVWTAADLFARSTVATAGNDRFYGTHGSETLSGGAGDDWISARNGDDILVGGTGNDFLSGGGGNDVYRFAKGDGNDTIVDAVDRWDGGEGGEDRIELGAGIAASDVTVSQQASGNDLLLTIAGGDSIYIGGAPITNGAQTIENVVFADGTVWTAADLFARSIASTAGNDRFYGSNGSETLSGGAGDDWISARNGDDVLVGGIGNDFLSGGGGNDVYRFAKGDGNDTIVDAVDRWDGGEGGDDRIELGAGIAASDVTVSQQANGTDLLLTIAGGDSIYIGGAPLTNGSQTIEKVTFADGTVWTAADLFAQSIAANGGDDRFYGTHGNDLIVGGAGNDWIGARNGDDLLIGGAGDDFLSGGGGNDTYRYARGDGDDTIVDTTDRWDGGEGGYDRVVLGDGIGVADVLVTQTGNGADLVVSVNGGGSLYIAGGPLVNGNQTIEELVFADGTVWDQVEITRRAQMARDAGIVSQTRLTGDGNYNELYGTDYSDLIEGKGQGDYLEGRSGSDVYVYTSGDGSDRINDAGNANDVDVFKLTNLNAADVSLRRDGSHLYVRDIATGQETRIDNQFYADAAYGIEQIQFADGTVWDRTAIQQAAWIRGNGNYNELYGSNLADTFEANGGGDYMVGGGSSDTYRYTSGDGGVRINEAGSANDTDVLKLTDLNAADVSFRRDGPHLYMRDIATGQESRIDNQFYSDATYGVEQIQFADGTVWDRTAIQQAAWIRGNGNYNELYGSDLADTFEANGGGDYMAGGGSSDSYRYTSGDGGVRINEAGSANDTDVLKLTDLNAADVSFRRDGPHLYMRDIATGQESRIDNQFYSDATYGIEQIQFADGTVWDRTAIQQAAWIRGNSNYNELYGSDSADTFEANGGGDYMVGGGSSDTYRYTSGDGGVRINEGGSANDTDVLKLTNLNAADVSFRRDGPHLYMRDIATGQESRIDNQFYSDATYGVEQIQFADGTVWDRTAIQQAAWIRGNGNYNELYGSDSADTFESNGGGDYMAGGNGSDTYRYTSGDGGGRIQDRGTPADTDVLKLTNLSTANVSLRRDGAHLFLRDLTTGQETKVDDQFWSDATYGIEQIAFADGTVWDRTAIQQKAWIRGNANYNELYGSDQADTFESNGGGDYMAGGNGSDTYRYTSGDGGGRIQDRGTAGDTDILKLTNLDIADVSLRRDGAHLFLRDLTTGQDIRIDDQFWSDATYGVEQISFANGTTWDRPMILSHLTSATSGADQIIGTADADYLRGLDGDDTLSGLAGGDELRGDGGNDVLSGGLGNDTLFGGDGNDSAQYAGVQADYQLTTVNGVLKVTDLNAADGDDGVDAVTSVETITFADASVSLAAPIVLDLNGDGLTLLNQQGSQASFDMDGDGRRDATSWVGADDGLLVFDRNGDGTIAGIEEISFTGDKPGATSDLDGLAAFDSDFDGSLSNGDQAFERFGIWRDTNGDGVVNEGELSSLKAAGIAAIGLTGTATTGSWDWDGGTVLNTGVFTRTDGAYGTFGDVMLSYTPAGSADAAAAAARLAEASAAFRPFDAGMINDIANDKGFAQVDAMFAFGNRVGQSAGGVI